MIPAILYSGGLDSFLVEKYVIRKLNQTPVKVYYNLRSRYSKFEKSNVLHDKTSHTFIDNTFNFSEIERDDAYIPNRNIHLATHAASVYSDVVYIGGTLSDRVADNNSEVFENLSYILSSTLDRKITVTFPFWDVYKVQAIEWFLKTSDNSDKARHELWTNTFSCFTPVKDLTRFDSIIYPLHESDDVYEIDFTVDGDKSQYETYECMNCSACFRKCAALHSCGISIIFKNIEMVNKYKLEFSTDIVNTPRTENTLDYIAWLEDEGYG